MSRAPIDGGLRDIVAQCRAESRAHLPPAAELAARLGVSPSTVQRACRRLAREGLLVLRQGSRARLPDVAGDRESCTGAPRLKRHVVAYAIRDRILGGEWSVSGTLPSRRALCRDYRVATPTIQHALTILERDSIISRLGGAYRINRPGAAGSAGAIVLIARFSGHGVYLAPHETWPLLTALERVCHASGAVTLLRGHVSYDGPCSHLQPDWTNSGVLNASRHAVVGFVVDNHAIVSRGVQLLHGLASHRLPIAVLAESDTPPLGDVRLPCSLLYVYPSSNRSAGVAVARYLHGNGHRTIAYLDYADRPQWSRERYAAMSDELRGPWNRRSDLLHFTIEATDPRADNPGDAVDSEATEAFVAEEVDRVLRRAEPFSRAQHAALADEVHQMLSESRRLSTRTTWQQIAVLTALSTTLEDILRDPAISAVVCSHDALGGLCVRYLERRGVDMPGRLSVCSFDDSATATAYSITSYNFGRVACVHRAVSHVLYPPRPSRPLACPPGAVTMEGYLPVRESSESW